MADGEDDDRFLSRREFYDYARQYDGDLAALKLDLATTKAKLEHMPDDMRELTRSVRSLETTMRANPQAGAAPNVLAEALNGLSLATQRMASQPSPRGSLNVTHVLATAAISGGGMWLWSIWPGH